MKAYGIVFSDDVIIEMGLRDSNHTKGFTMHGALRRIKSRCKREGVNVVKTYFTTWEEDN